MNVLILIGLVAMAAYFYWVVVTALIRGRTPDFYRDITRIEEPGKYWVQVVLCSLMALGSTISALFLMGSEFDL
jgi:hypothetical protein